LEVGKIKRGAADEEALKNSNRSNLTLQFRLTIIPPSLYEQHALSSVIAELKQLLQSVSEMSFVHSTSPYILAFFFLENSISAVANMFLAGLKAASFE
jgi:hypothetical protein